MHAKSVLFGAVPTLPGNTSWNPNLNHGSAEFAAGAGTYSWLCPPGVIKVFVTAVGGGQGSAGVTCTCGGGLVRTPAGSVGGTTSFGSLLSLVGSGGGTAGLPGGFGASGDFSSASSGQSCLLRSLTVIPGTIYTITLGAGGVGGTGNVGGTQPSGAPGAVYLQW